ncbi:MAG: hypothetical protein IT423_06695, partial [Pirellulaceae bacterium]|nr:hypothetical protein [Pirellulaceae bacterium]
MEARIDRPWMGAVALCAAFWLTTALLSTSSPAQFEPPFAFRPPMGASSAPAGFGMIPPAMQGMTHPGMMQPGMMQPGMAQPAAFVGRPVPGASMSSAAPMAPRNLGQSENFIVLCSDPKLTEAVSQAAERLRRELAVHWLGHELPNWSRRCPIQVISGSRLGAGGETRFVLHNGNVGDWEMRVQGTPERILDSVLPHEITHTILASHFAPLNVHVPRWADEGACTTVEHDSEQGIHKKMLISFMKTGRAMSFNRMFSLKDYPKDIMPLYAQGHSVVEFLIAQGGPQNFVKFLEQGMQSGRWESAVRDHYGYETLGKLQIQWNMWIADGRGAVDKFAGRPLSASALTDSLANQLPSLNVPAALASGPKIPSLEIAGAVSEGASVSLAGYTQISQADAQSTELTLSASSARPSSIAPRSTDPTLTVGPSSDSKV